jgi:hypothetical protein
VSSTTGRIAIFAIGLLAVFAGAVGIGSLVEPADTSTEAAHEEGGHGAESHGGGAQAEAMRQAPAGLAVSEADYLLHLDPTFLARGEARELRFSITDADGETVTDFDELHERRMHLIVVRRDGRGFRHLHPEMDDAGVWTVPIELSEVGVYRVFADFSLAGEQHTLATDLFVPGGNFEAQPLPPPASLDSANGYDVHLRAGEPHAGESSSLTFAVSKGGEDVDDLAPYLGAKGHLVALREGDLAFLHVHPVETADKHAHGGHAEEGTGSPNEIAFAASFPTAGRYRLYLQFKHEGAVQTAQFTVSVPR